MKKTIVKIVRDSFKNKKSFKGLYQNEKDHFYSHLYSHLIGEIGNSM